MLGSRTGEGHILRAVPAGSRDASQPETLVLVGGDGANWWGRVDKEEGRKGDGRERRGAAL